MPLLGLSKALNVCFSNTISEVEHNCNRDLPCSIIREFQYLKYIFYSNKGYILPCLMPLSFSILPSLTGIFITARLQSFLASIAYSVHYFMFSMQTVKKRKALRFIICFFFFFFFKYSSAHIMNVCYS